MKCKAIKSYITKTQYKKYDKPFEQCKCEVNLNGSIDVFEITEPNPAHGLPFQDIIGRMEYQIYGENMPFLLTMEIEAKLELQLDDVNEFALEPFHDECKKALLKEMRYHVKSFLKRCGVKVDEYLNIFLPFENC